MSLVSVMRSCHRLIVIVSAALFVQLSGQARADSPLTVRSGDISTVWQEVWGHAYSPNASTMLVSPATAGGLQIHASVHGFLRHPFGTRGHNARHHEEATTEIILRGRGQ